MVAVLKSSSGKLRVGGVRIDRDSDQSGADAELTLSTASGRVRRILFVTVKYSGSVTKNVTITLNSGAGSNWDTLLQTIALSAATDGVWIPDEETDLADDDVIDVVAPAGGVGVTAAVAVYTKVLE